MHCSGRSRIVCQQARRARLLGLPSNSERLSLTRSKTSLRRWMSAKKKSGKGINWHRNNRVQIHPIPCWKDWEDTTSESSNEQRTRKPIVTKGLTAARTLVRSHNRLAPLTKPHTAPALRIVADSLRRGVRCGREVKKLVAIQNDLDQRNHRTHSDSHRARWSADRVRPSSGIGCNRRGSRRAKYRPANHHGPADRR